MDIRMPHGSGIDACRTITTEQPGMPVIMLTSYADADALFAAIDAGASGYVLKRVGSTELVDAVRTVAAGGSLLDPAVTRSVLDRLRNASRLEEAGAFADLTDQERRVLSYIAAGASNREIATRMGLAEKTVRNYVSSLLAKLSLESRAQAAGYAIRNRLPELVGDEEARP
jgi:two-component system response regulator DevR